MVNNLSSRPTLNEYEYVMAGDQEVQHEELFLVDTTDKKLIKVPVEKWPDQTLRLFTPGRKGQQSLFPAQKENL